MPRSLSQLVKSKRKLHQPSRFPAAHQPSIQVGILISDRTTSTTTTATAPTTKTHTTGTTTSMLRLAQDTNMVRINDFHRFLLVFLVFIMFFNDFHNFFLVFIFFKMFFNDFYSFLLVFIVCF